MKVFPENYVNVFVVPFHIRQTEVFFFDWESQKKSVLYFNQLGSNEVFPTFLIFYKYLETTLVLAFACGPCEVEVAAT